MYVLGKLVVYVGLFSSLWLQKIECFTSGFQRSRVGRSSLSRISNAQSDDDFSRNNSESVDADFTTSMMGQLKRLKLWEEIGQIQSQLDQLPKDQQPEDLREKIEMLKLEDPYIALQKKMDDAITEQSEKINLKQWRDRDFDRTQFLDNHLLGLTEAGALQDALAAAGLPPPLRGAVAEADPRRACSSSEEHGVRVEARSFYSRSRSDPASGLYLFLYQIRLTNVGREACQLVRREWRIEPAGGAGGGRPEVVKGPGVVGQQPVLLPGQAFEYASACPLRSAAPQQLPDRCAGGMGGRYFFVSGATGENEFEVLVAPFSFLLPPEL
uniref:ApaG domain-containing protein n=1 Tax=Heterosigma akashiwo TaxID=2829 RepID=A0A7S4D4Z3_HETAK